MTSPRVVPMYSLPQTHSPVVGSERADLPVPATNRVERHAIARVVRLLPSAGCRCRRRAGRRRAVDRVDPAACDDVTRATGRSDSVKDRHLVRPPRGRRVRPREHDAARRYGCGRLCSACTSVTGSRPHHAGRAPSIDRQHTASRRDCRRRAAAAGLVLARAISPSGCQGGRSRCAAGEGGRYKEVPCWSRSPGVRQVLDACSPRPDR